MAAVLHAFDKQGAVGTRNPSLDVEGFHGSNIFCWYDIHVHNVPTSHKHCRSV